MDERQLYSTKKLLARPVRAQPWEEGSNKRENALKVAKT